MKTFFLISSLLASAIVYGSEVNIQDVGKQIEVVDVADGPQGSIWVLDDRHGLWLGSLVDDTPTVHWRRVPLPDYASSDVIVP